MVVQKTTAAQVPIIYFKRFNNNEIPQASLYNRDFVYYNVLGRFTPHLCGVGTVPLAKRVVGLLRARSPY